jgi:hypothetical protein
MNLALVEVNNHRFYCVLNLQPKRWDDHVIRLSQAYRMLPKDLQLVCNESIVTAIVQRIITIVAKTIDV